MDPLNFEYQQRESSQWSDSSSTQCSGVLSVHDDDDDGCTSKPPSGSSWQDKLHIQIQGVLNDQSGRLQTSAAAEAEGPVAPRSRCLAVDVSGTNSNNSACLDSGVDIDQPAAPWPAAFPPARRTFQAPVVTSCCTPSPRLSSPRVIFGASGTDNSSEDQHQQLQQWLGQREARLAGASDPAAVIAESLPPPAFLIMGLLN